MKVSELFEGYDTSERNRESFDSFAEWKREALRAGCEVVAVSKGKWKAEGWDGLAGEFDDTKNEGWLVEKWGKK